MSHGPQRLWAVGIKKGLAALGTQLGSRVSRARSCVTEVLGDVQAATVWLYSVASAQLTTPGHGYNGNMTRQDGIMALAMFRIVGWQVTRPGMPTPLKTPFATPSH
jgi:hypothetical protein